MPDSTKQKRRRPLIIMIIMPMIILSVLEALILTGAMGVSGQFTNIKRFSYSSLLEKTENRRNYVENFLTQKTALVFVTANAVNETVNGILEDEGLDISAVCADKELNKKIVSASAGSLVSLLRRDMVNDVFLILNTGTLYNEDGKTYMTGLYLRDTDVSEGSASGNEDIYLEAGSSLIAQELGMPLDYGWSLYMDMTDRDSGSLDFFYDCISGRSADPGAPLYLSGLWTGFSGVSGSARQSQNSMKYTLPLTADDGTVYGVIGIGLLSKTVLQNIPANDFFDNSACYILASDRGGTGTYEPLLFSGPAYGTLVDNETVLTRNAETEYGLYSFNSKKGARVGSISDITLYSAGSPYRGQKWALISVADKEMTLGIYNGMIKLFAVSIAVTVAVGVIISFLISRSISKPVSVMINALNDSRRNNTLVSFGSSGISEIDELADSIVELQIDVTEYASRVSRIITMAGSEIGVFMFDCRSKSVFVGESLIKLLHFRSMPDRDVTISFEEFRAQLENIDKEDKLTGLDIFSEADGGARRTGILELTYQPDEGEKRWLRFSLIRENNSVIGLVQDITGAVREKEIVAKVKDVEYTEKLIKANSALSDAYALARQASHAKTDFLSRMSHDIRTPMNAIIGMTAIAEMNLDDSEKVSDCLGKIESSSRYLLSLINEVLDMSKIESGKFVLSSENINIPDLIDNIAELLRPSVKDKRHELIVTVGELSHKDVIGDSTRIRQALVNILSNSVKYTPEGGRIEFSVCEKPFREEKIGCYEFVIRDNGIGMSEEFLKKLYEPFERANDVRVDKEQGTGLGMAITKNIVELMDGDIRVESETGRGTVFTVTIFLRLPDKGEKAQSSAGANMGESLSAMSRNDFSGSRALLVEDNELNREIACEILKMTGLEVESAVNGKEAVDMFTASPEWYYDMIFMDIQMPVMNGYEAAAAIRASQRGDSARVPIAAMTANTFAEDVESAKKAGMNEHIAKPLDFGKLTETLNRYLGGR